MSRRLGKKEQFMNRLFVKKGEFGRHQIPRHFPSSEVRLQKQQSHP